ncbi:MAG: hypothetical protein ACD_21C00016G0006 [uncultured bacterium]|nr:MAG: hypothetical protein ACD_21C00016G0006 [uncultured bacterium]
MQKVSASLSTSMVVNLKELSKSSGKSLSQIISELIEIGCKVKRYQETQKSNPQEVKKAELIDKHTEYLLRIMAIAADCYRCMRNEKSKYAEESVNDVLDKIMANAQRFIDGYLNRSQ